MSEHLPKDERLAKSYIWFGEQCYFVSTINRDSSSMEGGRYAETMVWEINYGTHECGRIVYSAGASEGSINRHLVTVKTIHESGIEGLNNDN